MLNVCAWNTKIPEKSSSLKGKTHTQPFSARNFLLTLTHLDLGTVQPPPPRFRLDLNSNSLSRRRGILSFRWSCFDLVHWTWFIIHTLEYIHIQKCLLFTSIDWTLNIEHWTNEQSNEQANKEGQVSRHCTNWTGYRESFQFIFLLQERWVYLVNLTLCNAMQANNAIYVMHVVITNLTHVACIQSINPSIFNPIQSNPYNTVTILLNVNLQRKLDRWYGSQRSSSAYKHQPRPRRRCNRTSPIPRYQYQYQYQYQYPPPHFMGRPQIHIRRRHPNPLFRTPLQSQSRRCIPPWPWPRPWPRPRPWPGNGT